jgi:S1-C subfamily serine protease|tara:strand:+ start:276 stop:1544 length:1269 start_codon:yes stop_codon:yes gene_type:complete
MGLFDIFNSEKKTKNDKSQSDSKIDLINDKRIAIFGFGNQAQAHALNLQDSGKSNIVIALREDSKNISKAESKGFKVMKLSKAAEWADILMMLITDEAQPEVYKAHIEQYVTEGTCIGLANTINLKKQLILFRSDLDVFSVSTKFNGDTLRSKFKKGGAVESTWTVHQNNSGQVDEIAKGYLVSVASGSPHVSENTEDSSPENSNKTKKQKEAISKDENPSKGTVGTGFFVNNEGYVITNYHVVKTNENNTKIMFRDKEKDAKMIAFDEILDIALLKVEVKNKNYIKFSNNSPKKAQSILVAGYPYGKYISDDLKITSGIINSLKGIKNNTSMLQIDATVNPGNSGGPIVDKDSGSLVGVATMKLSKDYTKAAFGVESENTNYGIKSSQVKDFLEANNVSVSIKKNKLNINELEESTVFVFS